jgi:hypothetical protein
LLPIEEHPVIVDNDFKKVNEHLDKMYKLIKENDITDKIEHQYALFDDFFAALEILFEKYKS